MPKFDDDPEVLPVIPTDEDDDMIEEPVGEELDTPEPEESRQITTVFGTTENSGTDELKKIRLLRNQISDGMNRIRLWREDQRNEPSPSQLMRDKLNYGISQLTINKIANQKIKAEGVIINDESTFESLLQITNTLERMIRERER